MKKETEKLEEKKLSTVHTNSSSLSVARGTADVKPAFRFVAAIVYSISDQIVIRTTKMYVKKIQKIFLY